MKALKVLSPRALGETEATHSQDDSNAVGIRTACPMDAVTCSALCGFGSSSKEKEEDR